MNIKTIPVPNAVFDTYLKELKIAELKVLLIIIRQTLGWKDLSTESKRKEIDWLSNNFLALKTGCSKRAINDAIQSLVKNKIIDVLSKSGELLDTSEKRKGQQKLFFRPANAIFAFVENKCKSCEKDCKTHETYAEFAEDLRKKRQELAQNMRYTR